MSTLFLIGNGFDINCGMKTKYTDVYEKYVNEPSETEIIKKFKETISGDLENWCDFEMEMARYADKLNSESEFVECAVDFSVYMRKHLQRELYKISRVFENKDIYDAAVYEVENSIKSFYKGFSPNVDRMMEARDAGNLGNIEVISFNYTNTIDRILVGLCTKKGIRKIEPIHIHGTLDDGPVFGVDNVNQIHSRYPITRKGLRTFVKPVFNEQYDQLRIEKANNAFARNTTICAYGMSFGDSDLTWRNKTVEWLRMSAFRHLFVYEYELKNKKFIVESEKMELEDEAKEKLLSKWGVDIDDPIFNQIHIPCGKNIFNVEDKIIEEQNQIKLRKNYELQETIEAGKAFVNKTALSKKVE